MEIYMIPSSAFVIFKLKAYLKCQLSVAPLNEAVSSLVLPVIDNLPLSQTSMGDNKQYSSE